MNKTLKLILIVGGTAVAAVGAVLTVQKVRVMMDEQEDADSDKPNVSYSKPVPKMVKKAVKRPIPITVEISESDDE